MKIIHLEGFTTEEKLTYKTIIYNNIITSMKALVAAATTMHYEIQAKVTFLIHPTLYDNVKINI